MSKTLLLTITAVLVIVGFLTFRTFQNPSSITPNFNQESTPRVAGTHQTLPNFELWHEFISPTGQFKVMMPSLPQHATEKITDPKTNQLRQYNMFVSEEDDGTLFMISIITMLDGTSPKIDEKLLSTVLNDMLTSTPRGKLRDKKLSTYHDHQSMDFSIENDEVIIDGKIFIVDQTLYALTSVAKKEIYQKAKFDFFVNSFSLQPTPKQ